MFHISAHVAICWCCRICRNCRICLQCKFTTCGLLLQDFECEPKCALAAWQCGVATRFSCKMCIGCIGRRPGENLIVFWGCSRAENWVTVAFTGELDGGRWVRCDQVWRQSLETNLGGELSPVSAGHLGGQPGRAGGETAGTVGSPGHSWTVCRGQSPPVTLSARRLLPLLQAEPGPPLPLPLLYWL